MYKVYVCIYPRPFSNGLGFLADKQNPSQLWHIELHPTTPPHITAQQFDHSSDVRYLVNNTVTAPVIRTADRIVLYQH